MVTGVEQAGRGPEPMATVYEEGREGPPPAFSICIPQYNRTAHLCEAIRSFRSQTFGEFEVCISDGGSTDGLQLQVVELLRELGLPFVLQISPRNLRYDENLRTAIGLARGRYCLLMGNDDALNGPGALRELWEEMQRTGWPEVVLNDNCDYATGDKANRIRETAMRGSGPGVAAGAYRNFSFVSGVVLARELALAEKTTRWDGAEMYQTYLGCRMIAAGGRLLERGGPFVRKDIMIDGLPGEGSVLRAKKVDCRFGEVRKSTLTDFARLVSDAIAPYAGDQESELNEVILVQHLGITLGYWLVTYRRAQSWLYALSIALGTQPGHSAAGMRLSLWGRLKVWVVYLTAVTAGLVVPVGLFEQMKRRLYAIAKGYRF